MNSGECCGPQSISELPAVNNIGFPTGQCFMVDTGVEFSSIPICPTDHLAPLSSLNGTFTFVRAENGSRN